MNANITEYYERSNRNYKNARCYCQGRSSRELKGATPASMQHTVRNLWNQSLPALS